VHQPALAVHTDVQLQTIGSGLELKATGLQHPTDFGKQLLIRANYNPALSSITGQRQTPA
jgi:hypothetical protein